MTASKRSPSSRARAFAIGAYAAAALLGAAAAHAQVPRFIGVGDLAGGAADSAALGVSADGSVVVGESESASGTQAFRWTEAGGIAGLGFLSGVDPYSTARAVSANGSVIVGTSRGSDAVERAYRWSAGAMTALDRFSCDSCDPVTQALAVSDNGLTVVGSALARSGGTAPLHLDPVRWPNGGTSIVDLGNLSGGVTDSGEAFGASSNGALIVGSHLSADGKDAWYWNGSGGLHVLPTITGGSIIAANAFAISADGTTIVGHTNQDTLVLPGGTEVPTDLQAVRWTGSGFGTLTQLGALPGASAIDSSALAVSSDGSRIVGRAVDADVSDRAFLWDAVHGMRDLRTVLEDEYGLDLTGWVLTEATGISAVTGGAFTVVGRGVNPQGNPEGWVAVMIPPACGDGQDNDGDTAIDFPADPECNSPIDWSEEEDCDDGIDNDGDGLVDHPADGGCRAIDDPTERPDCGDGLDNDGDADTDHPADAGCASPAWPVEDPACSNGGDDDGDTQVDFRADAQCTSASDLSETPDCSDGLDNDFDGLVDHPADPACASPLGPSEAAECSDGLDNDGDLLVDYPAQYPGCTGPGDASEQAQCSDGEDNDGDALVDHPADPGCTSPEAVSESPVALAEGDLVAVDRASAAVFRVDTATGAQTLISQAAYLSAPQGIAERAGLLVVADPAGLVAVNGSGAQRLASPPLVPKDSLQVVLDAMLDAYVIEETGISKVDWSTTGIGAKTTWLALPTPGPIPLLGAWHGDSIAVEASGDFVAGGLSLWGDGVYRITTAQAVSILRVGFEELRWLDLAVEADGTILAAGFKYNEATGVYRVDPVTGASTPLDNSYGWERPTGIAVAPDGDVFVADAGVCAGETCAGGEIVRVDPVTGAVTPLASGGFIEGELDLVVLPEPATFAMWLSGVALLAVLARRRSASVPRSAGRARR
jgi:probable HAF family extracellular repeat protein